ncbi:hypothetical protein K2Q02_02430 [Patescibacteria group bacterium]|nr:hypothetical protein [Patescibacteria group bacterium]
MKKTAFFSTVFALMVIVLGATTVEASTRYTYYPEATNYYDTYRNCTPRTSDLGLGGGVFVAGTTVCSTPAPLYVPQRSYTAESYYNQDKSYDSDSRYTESGKYEEDQNYDDEDNSSDNNSGNYEDNNNTSGGSGSIW